MDKLTTLLLNLPENVIKYAVPSSEITCFVRQSTHTDFIEITLINITSEESLPTANLQEAFHREDLRSSGTGLGLWLVSEITKLHCGTFNISSSDYYFKVMIGIPMVYGLDYVHLNPYFLFSQ